MKWHSLRAAVAVVYLLCGFFVSGAEVKLRWVVSPSDATKAHVEVAGLSNKENDWGKVLTVYVDSGNLVEQVERPPMAGSYGIASDTLTFTPLFPLHPGTKYRAVLKNGGLNLSSTYAVPARAKREATFVKMIYPSTNTVPENLLKFYVEFSASMSAGHVYDYIKLIDAQGGEIELPFLQIDEELWNPEMTRLTLFIDPGRIKRGVKPLEEIGPSMVEGKSYRLEISKRWRDAQNEPLKESYIKSFTVGPAVRQAIDPAKWKIVAPKAGSKEPVRVEFFRALDHAVALRKFWVRQNGGAMDGTSGLDQNESRWNFFPDDPWQIGNYEVCFEQFIEDLAGNNIGKSFEEDVLEKVDRRFNNKVLVLPFQIR